MNTVPQKYRQALVDDLTPHPRNPRQGDVGAIHESITHNGFYGAIIVQKATGHVLAGNHRLAAAKHAGAAKVPVIEIDCDDETALRILLADNRTNDIATYDDDELVSLLRELAEGAGLDGTGYDTDDLDAMLSDQTFAPPAPNPGDDGDNYTEQYGVIVICDDETHQQRVYDQLLAEGHSVRVVTT